jgi:cation diffusion facilitator CzcD-associated flavoprotein CzcO
MKHNLDPTTPLETLIIGAGFSGIAMGISLKRAGLDRFLILDEGSEPGGTWRDNTYPGAACDVESHLYSFSFAPNPAWSRTFSPQSEILEYIKKCTRNFQLDGHFRFGTRITSAHWNEELSLWETVAANGTTFRSHALVVATGGLSRPALPDLPGIDSFQGRKFHSARWPKEALSPAARVGVIGTGASAIQIIPQLAGRVRNLHVFQRTPHWVLPKLDGHISPFETQLLKAIPGLTRMIRLLQYIRHESLVLGFIRTPRALRIGEWFARRHIKAAIPDPELREKLTPSFRMGCKRILLSNDYYPALLKPGVALETQPIDSITPNGIRLKDGTERAMDTLIFATGFNASEAGPPFPIAGRDGRTLARDWSQGASAYRGTTMPGYPNAFMIVGPNTGLGHSSMLLMIEAQANYITQAVRNILRSPGLVIEVSPQAHERYQDWLKQRLAGTIWNTGCQSWYLTRDGRNTTLWPGTTWGFMRMMKRFDAENYLFKKPGSSAS